MRVPLGHRSPLGLLAPSKRVAPAVRVWRPIGPSEQKSACSAVQCGNRVLGAHTTGPCRDSPPDRCLEIPSPRWRFYRQENHREADCSDCSGSRVCSTSERPSSRLPYSRSGQTRRAQRSFLPRNAGMSDLVLGSTTDVPCPWSPALFASLREDTGSRDSSSYL